ncbi:MAG: FGGY-family carbohydrate kinase [Actinomycetota bacterium]
MTTVASVDFGAASMRVCRVDLDARPVTCEVVHRAEHVPVRLPDGSLRWDWDRLVGETITGLGGALERGPIDSIGVDTWAVDYGLLDGDRKLLSAPHSYRSDRTKAYRQTYRRVAHRRFYETCGLQVQPFNTIFQLAAHDRAELDAAAHLLFLPDLVVFHLTGQIATERTNAGSSGLYDLAKRDWSDELIDASGAPRHVFQPIVDAGTPAGAWRDIGVHRVAGHDTASAVVAIPAATENTAFVSSGTWLLVGAERDEPDTSLLAQAENFTNELGALGGLRFLKNVAGYWLLNECLRQWGNGDLDGYLERARKIEEEIPIFDATDPRFLSPKDMVAEIRLAAGLDERDGDDMVVRCIIESMAAATAVVIERLGDVNDVVLLGGGAKDDFLSERIADHARVPVRRGPVEAAALGNALVQGIALGVFSDLADARRALGPA